MKTCLVCNTSEGKYKCSTCEIPYCSVNCCKTHKEVPCEKVKPLDSVAGAEPPRTLSFTTIDTVPVEKLKELQSSERLKKLLHNPHLRQLLKEIDSSSWPDRAMQSAMMEPLFIEFADACLKVVEPDENAQESIED